MTLAEFAPFLTEVVAQLNQIMSFGAGLLSGLAFVMCLTMRF